MGEIQASGRLHFNQETGSLEGTKGKSKKGPDLTTPGLNRMSKVSQRELAKGKIAKMPAEKVTKENVKSFNKHTDVFKKSLGL